MKYDRSLSYEYAYFSHIMYNVKRTLLGRIASSGSSVVDWSVCLSIKFVSPAKTAESIEMPFEW